MSDPHWILLELETPELDPDVGQLREMGMVAVNRKLEPAAEWHSPIKPFHGDWLERVDPYVREMHSNSGLLAELRSGRAHEMFEAGGLPTLEQAEAVACAFVAQFGHPPDAKGRPQAIIAGANVGSFDRKWLARWTPKLHGMFSYRSLDTNFTFLAEQFLSGGPTEKSETRHRALADCYQALNGLRKFFGLPAWAGRSQ